MAQQTTPGFYELPKEVLGQIFKLCVDNRRLVGIHPSRDLRAAIAPLPAVASVNRKSREAFRITCAKIVDDAEYHAGPNSEKVPGNRHRAVYVSPELDTLIIGFETIKDGDLFAAPVNPMLAKQLKNVWLHDKDMIASLGHAEFHEDSLSVDIIHTARLSLSDLVYRDLRSITITSEQYDALLRGGANLLPFDASLRDVEFSFPPFGFKAIYHVETGLVFLTALESFEDANWLNKRLSNPAFDEDTGFMIQITIDRTHGIKHIDHAIVDGVVKDGMKEGQHSQHSDQGDPHEEEDMNDPEGLEHFGLAPDLWCYNWYLAVDYITHRLTK